MTDRQIEALKKSIKKYGFIVPVIVDGRKIVDGHQRHRAALELGLEEIPVVHADGLSQYDYRVLQQMMNKLRGKHDPERDAAVIRDLIGGDSDAPARLTRLSDDLGLDADYEIRKTLGLLGPSAFNPRSADPPAPEPPAPARASPGTIWRMGRHTVVCGDCMDAEARAALLSGPADIILTDPPYQTTDLALDNTGLDLDALYAGMLDVLGPSGWLFMFGTIPMFSGLLRAGWREKFTYVWVKARGSPVTHNTVRPMNAHELIIAANHPALKRPGDLYFDRRALSMPAKKTVSTVRHMPSEFQKSTRCFKSGTQTYRMEYDSRLPITLLPEFPNKSMMPLGERTAHPTQKPVAMLEYIIRGYCPPDGTVFDPFLGSGSTLIACEDAGRTCLGFEIDPAYMDIVIRRWEQLTGKRAERAD